MGQPPQLELFEVAAPHPSASTPLPCIAPPAVVALGERLPSEVRLGTSSWSFPGWTGLIYAEEASQAQLARAGLPAYAAHPLLRTVGIDRTFYGPVLRQVFSGWAEAVPPGFRFLAKAHEELTLLQFPQHARYGARRGAPSPRFLDAAYAVDAVVAPFVEGLGPRAGPLVFQFPPQDTGRLGGPQRFAERLHGFLAALPKGPLYGVEVRNAELLVPAYAEALAATGVVPVLAGWGGMPPVDVQARLTQARRARALVVRWMLRPGLQYEEARALYAPFGQLVQADTATRHAIASEAVAAFEAGRPVYVTINNKAEGCAPVSAELLARAIAERLAG